MTVYTDPTRTYLNKRISYLPPIGSRVRVAGEIGTLDGIADTYVRGSATEVEETCALVHIPGRGRVVFPLADVEVL